MEIQSFEDMQELNQVAENWLRAITPQMKAKIQNLSPNGRGQLARELKGRAIKRQSLVERLSFQFPQHGVFVEKGVGRGVTIEMLRGGTYKGPRKPNSWLNDPIDENISQLADDLNKVNGDIAVNAVQLKIR